MKSLSNHPQQQKQHQVTMTDTNLTTGAIITTPEVHLHQSKVVIKENSPRLFLLYGIVILQATIFLTELITDQFTHSLLILTDSYHHLFNTCNAILLIVCYKV